MVNNIDKVCQSCPYVKYDIEGNIECDVPMGECKLEYEQIEDTRDGQTYGDF